MSPHHLRVASRRRFLQFLAAGPLLTAGGTVAFAQGLPVRPADPVIWAPRDIDALIADPKQALDVFDFEPVARKNLPPAHFGLMVTGVDDEVTLRANREGFQKFQLRPRRLVDVSTIDLIDPRIFQGFKSRSPRRPRDIALRHGAPSPG
jgi:hypothetical protein